MEYDVKKGRGAALEGDGLKDLMEEAFGRVTEKDDMLVATYGALAKIEAKLMNKSTLVVNTASNTGVSDEVATDTIKRYNGFLEKATGFTSKQRRDRLQKKVKEGKL